MNLEELYEIYFSKVYNYVFFRIMNKEQSEDLTSAIFMKIVRNIDRYDPQKANVSTWIFRIANNTLIDYYRRRRPQASIDDENFTNIPKIEFDEQCDIIQSEDRKLLYCALYQLDERTRTIISLKYNAEMTIKEIASMLEINESTASTLHQRGLKKLRHKLHEDFFI